MRQHRARISWGSALLAAFAASAMLSTPVLASRGAVPRTAGLALPEYIGVLDYMGERTRTDLRPGDSYSYRAAGLALDVDVYAYDPGRLPDGIASALLLREFARMQQALERSGGARLMRDGTVVLGTGVPIAAREAVFARGGPGFAGTSYLWIAARGGRLYEMHFDVRAGFEEDGHVSRSEALAALGQAIAHPPVEPSVPPGPRVGVAILWDPATPPSERPLWTAYLYTRAAQVAEESDETPLPLGEHMASFEEEVRARFIALNLFRQMRRQNPAFASAYFADLDRVAAAGFLREYVWRYLRDSSWTRPDGLRLAAFDAWRAAHLRDHVPVTHGSIAVRLAAK